MAPLLVQSVSSLVACSFPTPIMKSISSLTSLIFLNCLSVSCGLLPGRAADDSAASFPITSPWGIGSDYHRNRTAEDNAAWIPQMEAIGITNDRTCETDWPALEPQKGKWTWDKLDAQIKYVTDHHFQVGGILIGSPDWNTKDKPGNLPVHDLKDWSDYVFKTVDHAKSKIAYWEVWNEPPNFTGRNQTPQDYAKIVSTAYDAAKKADPKTFIGMATKSVDLSYLSQAIKAGAKDHFDYITLHPYEVLDGIVDNKGTEAVFMHIVPTVRKMLADLDPAKKNVPIVLTEIGCDAGNKGPAVQAYALVKTYAMGLAEGITCINWFEGIDGDSGPMAMLKADGTPRPSYTAMAQIIKALGPHPAYLGWLMLNGRDNAFLFQGPTGPVLVAWVPKGPADNINFGQPVTITDPLTGKSSPTGTYTLTTSPILATGIPASLVSEAQANREKPYPWDGDYSKADAVSITMGAPPVEKGLHTQAAADVAKDIIAYGGSARAGSVPGGNLYIIDPNFICYTATPVEIDVRVRRDAANDKAGFKLVYESTTGYKTLPWYTIPDNKKWYDAKFRITDDEFVNNWNYSFSLDSDGDKYNKYDIQSVTVRKVAK